jgi:hypothetical protein
LASFYGSFALRELVPGAISPRGWLRDQLALQARGATGRLPEVWPDAGPNSGWLGGTGECWERGPYFLDGLIPLAHALADADLLALAQRWIDAILASQRPDGWFGPDSEDWWPRIVALKALVQHADATGDERIVPFLERYFAYQAAQLPARPFARWARARGNDEIVAIAWLHERTGDPALAELAQVVLDQSTDWERWLRVFPHREVTKRLKYLTHVVNVAMGIKAPAMRFLLDGDPAHRETLDAGLANLDRFHGQVHGMFSGDEHLAGTDATRGVETCAVVEMMFSLQTLIRVWGSAAHADLLERIAYNLMPAALTADVTSHQYHQQANQVLISVARRDWTAADDDSQTFGLEPNYGCCTANLHQGWPKLLRTMWYATEDGGLAALVHGPSTVRWDGPEGVVEIETTTTYPFGDILRYEVLSGGGEFPLRLRIPAWCSEPELAVDGASVAAIVVDGFVRVERRWTVGDVVELRLPAVPRLVERPSGGAGVTLGSLQLVHAPGEIWERYGGSDQFGEWEVRSRRNWGLGLVSDAEAIAEARVERGEPGAQPFALVDPPLRVWVEARDLPDWPMVRGSAAPPAIAVATDNLGLAHARTVALVPYGTARIRVAEFPLLPPDVPGTTWNDAQPNSDDGADEWEVDPDLLIAAEPRNPAEKGEAR